MTETAETYDDVENTEKPTIEELQAQLAEMEDQLNGARERITELNNEGKTKRLKLKEMEQEKQDAEAAAKEYQQQFQQTHETVEELRQRVANTEKKAEVERAISEHGGIPELLRPVLEQMAEVSDEGVVVGKQSVDDYVASLRDDVRYGQAFRGRGQSGAGTTSATGTKGQQPPPTTKARSAMTDHEKRAFISSYGFEQYQKLPLG